MLLYKHIKSLGNGGQNVSRNRQVQRIIYWEFYHGIVHIENEGCNIRIHYFFFICDEQRYNKNIDFKFSAHNAFLE